MYGSCHLMYISLLRVYVPIHNIKCLSLDVYIFVMCISLLILSSLGIALVGMAPKRRHHGESVSVFVCLWAGRRNQAGTGHPIETQAGTINSTENPDGRDQSVGQN